MFEDISGVNIVDKNQDMKYRHLDAFKDLSMTVNTVGSREKIVYNGETSMSTRPDIIRQRLTHLKLRLEQAVHAWTVDDYWALLEFYVDIVPVIVPAERCTIFIIEMGTEKICSFIGTGLQKMHIEPPKDKSIAGKVISTGQPMIAIDLDKSYGYHTEVGAKTGFVTRNMVCAPIKSLTGHGVTGAIQVLNRKGRDSFTSEDLDMVNEIARHLSISIESLLLNREIFRISSQLNREVERFDESYFRDVPFVAESPAMKEILNQVWLVSGTPVNVLIQGENGTGKELIARLIHEESNRREQSFVAVNCASIPETLVESEFFGYEKGAFTGAQTNRRGYFEEASGGTLFLDEVADMPMSIQPKFLRALQEGEGYRLGSKRLIKYDLRIISATNKNLKQEVEVGRFREDLFFRLFSVEIHIPPLRERKEDIAPMAFFFLEDICRRFEKKVVGFSPEVINLFEEYHWPGNVRQLRREVERMVVLTPAGERITPNNCSKDLLQSALDTNPQRLPESLHVSLPEQVNALEIRLIQRALKEAGGNRTRTAELLGITRQGLHKKMKRYNLTV
jgi:transcriptional regulator with GAF, ATPase, and Fis domain